MFKKRTKEEVQASVKAKDYTGGYKFLPWTWHMRKRYLLGLLANKVGGVSLFFVYAESKETITLIGAIFFSTIVPTIISYMLRRDYTMLKKGQSS